MTHNPPAREQLLPPHLYESAYEDEINLVDVWLVLMRRRAQLVAVVGLCVLAGVLFTLLVPAKYQYSTSIEIGTRLSGEKVVVIESPETLQAKIQESYIPLARQQFFTEHAEGGGSIPKIDARIPKGSQIIVLSSNGVENNGAAHKVLQQAVVGMVKKDHSRIVDVLRMETEIFQNQAMAKLDEQKDEAILIRAREKRLGDISALLIRQAKDVRSDLARAKVDRANAIQQTKDESRALTLMMLDSGMQQYSQRLAEIDERLKITIVESRDKLIKGLADNRRAQLSQQDTIAKLKIQLVNLRETRALMPPIRSSEPTGMGASLVMVLSLVLGLMLSVFTAFFAEFLAKVRSQSLAP